MAMAWHSAETSLSVLPGMSLDVFLNRFPPLCETSRISLGTPLGLAGLVANINPFPVHAPSEPEQMSRPEFVFSRLGPGSTIKMCEYNRRTQICR